MSFLKEIKNQPRATREIMFVLCVITSISMVSMIWYRSFEEDAFVMLNPEPEKQAQFFAARDRVDQETETLFATIGSALSNMTAAVLDAVTLFESDSSKNNPPVEVKKLPISDDK